MTFTSEKLTKKERKQLKALLRKNIRVFLWNVKQMQDLDPRVSSHKLDIDLNARPVQQRPRRMTPERRIKLMNKWVGCFLLVSSNKLSTLDESPTSLSYQKIVR